MSNKRMKSEMEKKQNKKAPKGRGSGKMKPPSSEGPSHASVPVVNNSSLLNSFVATSATYPTNQQFPTMSFPVSDVYAPYTLYNQNPASVLPFSQLNLPYGNMHQGGNYITQLNQNPLSDR
uniref:uncharacterized protein LOC105351183 isoform X4 n=1 Tax=Fragaria vesca subsp. vesca TaxID=101020 RepID=UPI0005C950B4|nr:PREDICTED: uncharacterized protein LOC105351183 isoform X4 [Fragaria vesca subsp. vesca]